MSCKTGRPNAAGRIEGFQGGEAIRRSGIRSGESETLWRAGFQRAAAQRSFGPRRYRRSGKRPPVNAVQGAALQINKAQRR